MAEDNSTDKKSFSLDWLVGGVLTKLGDTFDRFTGRGWNPSSSLATSELIEKLKFLLDSEVRNLGVEGKFVPHIIKLKMQWNKFSTEAETEIKKLEHELHAAAIDRINDKLYHTFAPLEIEIKTDYFTEGVRMIASFGKFAENEADEVAVNVSIPNLRTEGLVKDNKITVNLSEEDANADTKKDTFLAKFTFNNQPKEVKLDFNEKRRISVGRLGENDLSIPDQSVSKVHASLVLDGEKQLKVADTGSTNGTFINSERIAYGKALSIADGAKVKFGTVEVVFERLEELEKKLPEEFENPAPVPTGAIMNLNQNEIQPQIKPSKSLENPENFTELDKTIAEFPVNEANLESSIDKSAEYEEIKSQPETVENENSKEINIDKTQDWEI
ncbi:MAG: FHA domain-containing protein [Acidobacteriota bacterium]|jgi:pSer/pThr/pTyr-binding forkhead associated (FHA) protein|nr:FHA domain-containing protein [Acidobacteriota bacterium]